MVGAALPEPVGLAEVQAAATRLDGVVHRTPVLTSRTLDDRAGGHLLLKAESLQRGGAFKLRGAYHAMSRLSPEQLARGVVAYSSGNHAQAVALAARLLSSHATILMPTDAPAPKLAATRGYGAEVVLYDRYTEDREQLGAELARDRGVHLVPPFDDPDVIAGQGTVALELLEQAEVDLLVVPIGGGGLAAGCAAAVKGLRPDIEVVGVEPAGRRAARAALEAGAPVAVDVVRTILDGQQTTSVGAHPLAVLRDHLDAVVGVDDDAVRQALRLLFERVRIVVEPSGAAALAAVLDGTIELDGRRAGVVLSGGNVDLARLPELLASA